MDEVDERVCSACFELFPSKVALDKHFKEEHQTLVIIKHSVTGENIKVHREQDGYFHCPCHPEESSKNPSFVVNHASCYENKVSIEGISNYSNLMPLGPNVSEASSSSKRPYSRLDEPLLDQMRQVKRSNEEPATQEKITLDLIFNDFPPVRVQLPKEYLWLPVNSILKLEPNPLPITDLSGKVAFLDGAYYSFDETFLHEVALANDDGSFTLSIKSSIFIISFSGNCCRSKSGL